MPLGHYIDGNRGSSLWNDQGREMTNVQGWLSGKEESGTLPSPLNTNPGLAQAGPWLLSGGPGTCLHAAMAGRYFPSVCDQIERRRRDWSRKEFHGLHSQRLAPQAQSSALLGGHSRPLAHLEVTETHLLGPRCPSGSIR